MDNILRYLRLDEQYRQYLGGLRWAMAEDLLEYDDGRTFAFTEEIALFLEGFGSARQLVHFGFILHLLEMLRGSQRRTVHGHRPFVHDQLERLRRAFEVTGKPLRNAGVLCGLLCRKVPRQPDAIDLTQLLLRLRNQAWPIRHLLAHYHDQLPSPDFPPLGPRKLETDVCEAIQSLTDEELHSWLRHGHVPLREVGEETARQLALPEARTLTEIMDQVLERTRLAGTRPFVAQMLSALTLPPRRLAREEIPVGGYADVTTHGQVEQILPSQFALDDLEFVRRFAERELLYFRREEPNQRTSQELVVVLDQGVRTWGAARMLLSAAVAALARQAERRRMPFLLTATSAQGKWLDPVESGTEALGALLEASDLTAHPGLALEWVLEQPCTGARDVVLLTHPRSMKEEDLRAAMLRLPPEARLFTLSVDGHGAAALDQIKHGAACEIRRFQVDLNPPSSGPQPSPAKPRDPHKPWSGDIEPIPFPFRFGPSARIPPHLFQFDFAGDWLLAGSGGMLYAWKTDGSDMEVLPRGMFGSDLLKNPQAILGVAGGFVVAGTLQGQLKAVHYDFVWRVATAHSLGEAMSGEWEFDYLRERHAVVARNVGGRARYALDLSSGNCYPYQQFIASWSEGLPREAGECSGSRPGRVRVLNSARGERRASRPVGDEDSATVPGLYMDPRSGRFVLEKPEGKWRSFLPRADGQPLLQGFEADAAECRGDTLAVLFSVRGQFGRGRERLCVFDLKQEKLLTEFPMAGCGEGFTLSEDGEILCRKVSPSRLEIHPLFGQPGKPFLTRKVQFSAVDLYLTDSCCVVQSGNTDMHVLKWQQHKLELSRMKYTSGMIGRILDIDLSSTRSAPIKPSSSRTSTYDSDRFIKAADGPMVILIDCFGQLAFCDHRHKLICMAIALPHELALWMPDGTCYGSASLTGKPPTPGALEKIGRALWQASRGDRG